MKKSVLFAAVAAFASCVLADPSVVDGSVSILTPEGEPVSTITYTLTGGPAIVTIDIETNELSDASGAWVQVDGQAIGSLVGEANRVVRTCDTPVKAYLRPSATWNRSAVAVGALRAVVRAWKIDDPPDYMVVNLTETQKDVVNPRSVNTLDVICDPKTPSFYASAQSLPGGLLENVAYRTDKIVMRRIPAANVVWKKGSPTDELPGESSKYDTAYEQEELLHNVKLTKDYYMAVFEMTQGQYYNFKKWNPSGHQSRADWKMRPVEKVEMAVLRGRSWTSRENHAYCWPEDGHGVSTTSALGMLRELTGVDFDLPTDAEWEYACRAGCGGAFANGATDVDNASKIGWYLGHVSVAGEAEPVGTKSPNDFGIYDMHGNVAELLLDNNATAGPAAYKKSLVSDWETGGVTIDPKGPLTDEGPSSTSSTVIRRGGSMKHSWVKARSAAMMCGSTTWVDDYIGFRVACPIDVVKQ